MGLRTTEKSPLFSPEIHTGTVEELAGIRYWRIGHLAPSEDPWTAGSPSALPLCFASARPAGIRVNRVQLGCTVPGFFFFSGSHPSLTAPLSLSNSLSQTPISLFLSHGSSRSLPQSPWISLGLSSLSRPSLSRITLSHSGRRKNKGEKKNRGRRMGLRVNWRLCPIFLVFLALVKIRVR